MPVSRSVIDEGKKTAEEAARPVKDRVLEFLGKDPNSFYDAEEIYRGVYNRSLPSGTVMAVEVAFAIFLPNATSGTATGPTMRLTLALAELKREGLIQEEKHNYLTVYGAKL